MTYRHKRLILWISLRLLNNILRMRLILITFLLVIKELAILLTRSTLVLVNLCSMIIAPLLILSNRKLLSLMLIRLLNSYLRLFVSGLIIRRLIYFNFLKRRKIVMKQSNWVSFRNQVLAPVLLQMGILLLQDRLDRLSQPEPSPTVPTSPVQGEK